MNKFADFMTDEEARLELNIPPPHAHGHAPDVSLAEQGLFLPIAGQKQAPSFCWAWACLGAGGAVADKRRANTVVR